MSWRILIFIKYYISDVDIFKHDELLWCYEVLILFFFVSNNWRQTNDVKMKQLTKTKW